jgi:hypothetical protein
MHAQIVLFDGFDPLDVIEVAFIPCDRRHVERPVSASQPG